MKNIYRYGTDMVFSSMDIMPDNYALKDSETFVAVPQGGLMPIRWAGSAWQQATPEEHAAYIQQQQAAHPEAKPSNEPTTQDKLNATTSVQLANLMQANQEQKQINANLTVQIAQLLKNNQTTDTKTTDTTATTAQAKA